MNVKITEIHFSKWRKSDQTQAIKHSASPFFGYYLVTQLDNHTQRIYRLSALLLYHNSFICVAWQATNSAMYVI